MSASQGAARLCLAPTRRPSGGRRRFTGRTGNRAAFSLLALTGVLFFLPAMAAAAETVGSSTAASTSPSAMFWGLDLVAVLWLTVGLLAVIAGLFAGSGSSLGTPLASAPAASAELSTVSHSTAHSTDGDPANDDGHQLR